TRLWDDGSRGRGPDSAGGRYACCRSFRCQHVGTVLHVLHPGGAPRPPSLSPPLVSSRRLCPLRTRGAGRGSGADLPTPPKPTLAWDVRRPFSNLLRTLGRPGL